MPIVYKIDILAALKEKGYNTNRLRKEKLLSEGVIQSLRENKYIALQNISKICELLDCQPADLLEYQKEEWKNGGIAFLGCPSWFFFASVDFRNTGLSDPCVSVMGGSIMGKSKIENAFSKSGGQLSRQMWI